MRVGPRNRRNRQSPTVRYSSRHPRKAIVNKNLIESRMESSPNCEVTLRNQDEARGHCPHLKLWAHYADLNTRAKEGPRTPDVLPYALRVTGYPLVFFTCKSRSMSKASERSRTAERLCHEMQERVSRVHNRICRRNALLGKLFGLHLLEDVHRRCSIIRRRGDRKCTVCGAAYPKHKIWGEETCPISCGCKHNRGLHWYDRYWIPHDTLRRFLKMLSTELNKIEDILHSRNKINDRTKQLESETNAKRETRRRTLMRSRKMKKYSKGTWSILSEMTFWRIFSFWPF